MDELLEGVIHSQRGELEKRKEEFVNLQARGRERERQADKETKRQTDRQIKRHKYEERHRKFQRIIPMGNLVPLQARTHTRSM